MPSKASLSEKMFLCTSEKNTNLTEILIDDSRWGKTELEKVCLVVRRLIHHESEALVPSADGAGPTTLDLPLCTKCSYQCQFHHKVSQEKVLSRTSETKCLSLPPNHLAIQEMTRFRFLSHDPLDQGYSQFCS